MPRLPNIIQVDGALHERLKAEAMRLLRLGQLRQARGRLNPIMNR